MSIFGRWFGAGSKPLPTQIEPQPPDTTVLVTALLDEVRRQGVTGELHVQGNYMFIDDGDGAVRHVFLGNLAHEYAAAGPAIRHELLAKYARLGVRPMRVAASDLRTRVMPKLSPRRERELLHLRYGDRPKVTNLLAGRTLADGELLIELAVDEPEVIRVLVESDLAGCKLDEDEAYVLALSNLRQRSTGRWEELIPGLLQSPWGDFWDGARLALPSLFRSLPIKGDPIVVIPNRCAVLVTGSEEPLGLAMLYKASHMLMSKERPLYLAPLRLDGDRWRALDVEADAAAIEMAPSLLFLSSLQESLDHAVCGELVRERLAARGFTSVSDVGALEGEGIPFMTVTAYAAGERVAIPRVDMVAFDIDGTPSLVAWYKVEAMLGDDLVPLDVWPPFYEVRRQPPADEIARVRVRAPRGA